MGALKCLVILLFSFLQACSLFSEKTQYFYGEFESQDKHHLSFPPGGAPLTQGPLELTLTTDVFSNTLKEIYISQYTNTVFSVKNINKSLVYGNFTLEQSETGLAWRIEGNIKRNFLSSPRTLVHRDSCTFAGICQHTIIKEEKTCSGFDATDCDTVIKEEDVLGYYDKCPGWEEYTSTYQNTQYEMTLVFYSVFNNELSGSFYGKTDVNNEETSNIKTRSCDD